MLCLHKVSGSIVFHNFVRVTNAFFYKLPNPLPVILGLPHLVAAGLDF